MKKKWKRLSQKKKIIILLILVLLLMGVLGFLFKDKIFGSNKKVESKVESKEPEKPKVKIIDENSKSRPYAVMINNNQSVWPYQSGLMKAYMIYELLVEGGITREMAMYKDSDVEKIASIRSSRHYFLDYVLENDALYVHWGWSPQAQRDISSLGIANINGLTYEGKYFFRDNSVRAGYEHRGYSTMSSLKEAAEAKGYRTTTDEKALLKYTAEPLDFKDSEEAVDAKYVAIRFSDSYQVRFLYNEEKKVYSRKQNYTDMYDYTSGEEFTAKNIITYKAGYSNIYGDDKGRLNMSNTGSGDGFYITEGKAIPIKWSKESRGSKTKYTYTNGEELVVNDGNTYIEINPTYKTTDIQAEIPA